MNCISCSKVSNLSVGKRFVTSVFITSISYCLRFIFGQPNGATKLRCDQMSNCTQPTEFKLNILLLQSTVIRNVNCSHAHSVSLSAWLERTREKLYFTFDADIFLLASIKTMFLEPSNFNSFNTF
jgi:hypothetical protein